MRPTEAVIDRGALGRNVERLVALAGPATVCAVTKADGYGHGSVECTRVALEAGASHAAVALVEEGIELRRSGCAAPILVLSEPRPGEMVDVVQHELSPTVYSPTGLTALIEAAGARPGRPPVDVHLNLDTGMNRVGLRPEAPIDSSDPGDYAIRAVQAINDAAGIRLDSVWTHFAVADEPDRPETAKQLARFANLLDALAGDLASDVMIHAANSAGFLAHPEARFDMVRLGIAMYGIEPAPGLATQVELEPVMTLASELSMVKPVFAGESISYGLKHTFATNTRVGTIPMGYADGLRRDASAQGCEVLIGGHRYPLVGTVTMDHAMVDLGPDSSFQAGEPVVIAGSQGDDVITVAEIADRLDTIPYEIVCDVGRRVRRRYV